jgi:uncharacterized phage-like protein YoqJ
MDLPKKESTFEFEHVAKMTDKKYDGKFTVRTVLNMGQRHQLEMEKTRLMADYVNPTDGLAGIAVILSKLRVHVIDGPEWWKQSAGGFLIDDEDALVALYDKVIEAENKWKNDLKKKGEEAKEQAQKVTPDKAEE